MSANEQALAKWRDFVARAISQNRIVIQHEKILVRGGRVRSEALARIIEPDTSGVLGDRLVPAGKWIDAIHTNPKLSQAFDWHVVGLVFSQPIQPKAQVWINLTMHTIKSPEFVSRFEAMMDRYGIDPASIAIEATEQSAGNGAALNLHRLHNHTGVAIVVDDFGSGYSNLLAITRLPLYALKLDGRFVQSYRDPHVADLIRVFAGLCRRWQVMLVAEWVEDPECWSTLEGWGVVGFQGWAIK